MTQATKESYLCSCGAILSGSKLELTDIMLRHGQHEITGCGGSIGPYPCCTVMQGDCLELLKPMGDKSLEAIITDPPYNCGKNYGTSTNDRMEWPEWIEWFDARLLELLRVSSDTFCFLSQTAWRKYVRMGNAEPDWSLIWSKPLSLAVCAMPFMPHWEAIAYWGSTRKKDKAFWGSDVISCNVTPNEWGHPTEKPEALMLELVSRIFPATILDPFCGSGTTLVAAAKLGRHYLGMEISPEYTAIARKRLAAVHAQPKLPFEPKPEQMELPR